MSEPHNNAFAPFFDEIRRIVREEIEASKDRQPKELLTPNELAERLKVSVTWVYEASRQGKIPTHRIGRYVRFDLREVLESQQKRGDEPF